MLNGRPITPQVLKKPSLDFKRANEREERKFSVGKTLHTSRFGPMCTHEELASVHLKTVPRRMAKSVVGQLMTISLVQ